MYRTNYFAATLAELTFMGAATGLALYTGFIILAAMFGAKAGVSIISLVLNYRREKRIRRQLIEHLYNADVYVRLKR